MSSSGYRICVLASGNGSTFQAIVNACRSGYLQGKVITLISNKPSAFALKRAEKEGIESIVIDSAAVPRQEYDARLLHELSIRKPDIICLAGYLRILPASTISSFPLILNIHPALLPKFGGKGMYGINVHQAVIAAGEKESGCTVHIVTERVDDGPTVVQRRVPVLPGDNAESLKNRVHAEELMAYPEAIKKLMEENHPGRLK
ncbi:MAG: phosphoribosylglycinamide formyltransferase [Thermoplasmata archaeon]|nr:phosphoribosylglycinamide formyltransferase [Candidatus Sysuiplasma acidicola]MBX8638083.1 phosphoribosylglycinamide formyltransferase [Candidatus Sysuiplasma acidicola]MBX8646718.1 phosphoribosylglycinamide formyltransferase [Candidatus Sysuiplasma acidicola]